MLQGSGPGAVRTYVAVLGGHTYLHKLWKERQWQSDSELETQQRGFVGGTTPSLDPTQQTKAKSQQARPPLLPELIRANESDVINRLYGVGIK